MKKIFTIILIITFMFTLTGCSNDPEKMSAPIEGWNGIGDIFVYPMAGIMWVISKTIGFGNYAVTIIISTLVVRTIAWPIYGKTNDMQLKMQLVQPEMEKIQKRYEGKDDEASKQRMSMETMQLYKKYGIGLGGCLMPFIQMPLFIGFYRTISRMPYSIKQVGNWIGSVFKTTEIFGVDMILKQNEIILNAIVPYDNTAPIINIGIGTLSIDLINMQSKFVPSKDLKSTIKLGVTSGIDPLECVLEQALAEKLINFCNEVI